MLGKDLFRLQGFKALTEASTRCFTERPCLPDHAPSPNLLPRNFLCRNHISGPPTFLVNISSLRHFIVRPCTLANHPSHDKYRLSFTLSCYGVHMASADQAIGVVSNASVKISAILRTHDLVEFQFARASNEFSNLAGIHLEFRFLQPHAEPGSHGPNWISRRQLT